MSRLAEFDQKWLESKGFSRPICRKSTNIAKSPCLRLLHWTSASRQLGSDDRSDIVDWWSWMMHALELQHGDCVSVGSAGWISVSVGSAGLWFVKLSVVDLPVLAVHVDRVRVETCQQPTQLILVLPSLTQLIPFVIVPMWHCMQCRVQTNRGSVWVSDDDSKCRCSRGLSLRIMLINPNQHRHLGSNHHHLGSDDRSDIGIGHDHRICVLPITKWC